jgi:hypothetical protein
MADYADLVGAVNMVSGEFSCPANSSLVAKPAIFTAFDGMRHLRRHHPRLPRFLWKRHSGGGQVTGLTEFNGQTSVILGNARRVGDAHLVAHQAVLTAHQVMGNAGRGDGRKSRLRKQGMAGAT